MNTSKGKDLNISPDQLLLQSSTKAQMIEGEFPDGIYSVPGSYVEFAYRGILDHVALDILKGKRTITSLNESDLKGKGVLFSKNDVVVYNNNKKENYKAKNIVIATGSTATNLPGVEIDEERIISSTGALKLREPSMDFVSKFCEYRSRLYELSMGCSTARSGLYCYLDGTHKYWKI